MPPVQELNLMSLLILLGGSLIGRMTEMVVPSKEVDVSLSCPE